jgi:hypothetical protein
MLALDVIARPEPPRQIVSTGARQSGRYCRLFRHEGQTDECGSPRLNSEYMLD